MKFNEMNEINESYYQVKDQEFQNQNLKENQMKMKLKNIQFLLIKNLLEKLI